MHITLMLFFNKGCITLKYHYMGLSQDSDLFWIEW